MTDLRKKIQIDLSEYPNTPVAGETLWAKPIGGDHYQLCNIPSFAFGYGEGDIVRCEEIDGELRVKNLVRSLENGVIRVYFHSISSTVQNVIGHMQQLGCTYERATEHLFLISIPESSILYLKNISDLLNNTDEVEAWEIAKMPGHMQEKGG